MRIGSHFCRDGIHAAGVLMCVSSELENGTGQLGGRRWKVRRGLWQKRRLQMLIQQTTDLVDPSIRAQEGAVIDHEAFHTCS